MTAGVTIREVDELDDLQAAGRFLDALWQRTTPSLPLELLRAMTHAGNYAAVAEVDDQLVGALTGFLGWHDGQLTLHSHILGVAPEAWGHGIGSALKHHQREWARERAIPTITWTFDPLVARNARFNFGRLGVRAVTYLEDFYGVLNDRFNTAEPTDRLLVAWDVEPVTRPAPPSDRPSSLLEIGAGGRPVIGVLGPATARCRIPDNILGLRRAEPALAREWRRALRATLGAALRNGYELRELTRDGAYLLRRGETGPPQLAGGP